MRGLKSTPMGIRFLIILLALIGSAYGESYYVHDDVDYFFTTTAFDLVAGINQFFIDMKIYHVGIGFAISGNRDSEFKAIC